MKNVNIGEKITKENSYFEKYGMFDQLTLNDYMPGQGIPPHVDTHSPFEEVFASLSLKSGVTMHFKTPEGLTKDLYLIPRSLVIFSGEVRFNWLHSISLRKVDKVKVEKDDSALILENNCQFQTGSAEIDSLLKFRHRRVSLTFRKVRTVQKCQCRWPKLCDSQNKAVAIEENMLGGEDGEAPVYKENKE